MIRPRIFISAVSEELATARRVAKETVRLLGFDPVSQDDFETGYGELVAWLRHQIDSCDGLIQIVGFAYGAEPPTPIPDFGRVSYTQFELLYAIEKKIRPWVLIAREHVDRDKPVEELDLPRASSVSSNHSSDPEAYRQERYALQQAYLARLRGMNLLRHNIDDTKDIKLKLHELRNELLELRRQWEEWLKEDSAYKQQTAEQLREIREAAQQAAENRRALSADELSNILHALAATHRDQLENLDREEKWHEWTNDREIGLDSEVESFAGTRSRKHSDLLRALAKHHREQLILVVGEAGSGKSVAVRNLCKQLIGKFQKPGWRGSLPGAKPLLPFYVSLRQWVTTWTADSPPTVDEVRESLRKFIVDEMSRCLTGAHKRTVEEWFDSLLESKRVLLVLDAFDEISALLDADSVETDTSVGGGNRKQQTELLRAITQGVESYFQQSGARGIVAARPYCAPVWKSGVRLRIRPMSELRIAQLLRKASLPESAIRDFFSHHGDLVSLARNPFLANLLVEYLAQDDRATRGQFPANQADLYRDFFKARLVPRILRAAPKSRGDADPITASDVEETTCAVADTMFEQALLELPEDRFPPGLQTPKARRVIAALCAGRFLRRGQDDNRLLSFAHRRFAEFFALEARLKRHEQFSASLLAERSRWSEALILYCGIAEPADAERIAGECWGPVRAYRDAGADVTAEQMRGVRAYLRILAEAFRNRREVLGELRGEIGQFVQGCLARPRAKGRTREAPQFLNVEMAEAALNAVILCPDDGVGTIAQHAFDWDNEALTEVALRQCRYLPRSDRRLEFKLFNYISRRSPMEILRGRRETSFALNLSESTRAVYWYHRMRVWESRGFFALHAAAIGLVLFAIVMLMSSRFMTNDASPGSAQLSPSTWIWWTLGTCSVWALLWVIFYHCCALVASIFVGFRNYNRLDLARTAPGAFAAFFCVWEFFKTKFSALDGGGRAMALGTFVFFLLSFPWTFPWIFYRMLRFSGQSTQAFFVGVARLWPLWVYGLLAYVYWRFLSDYSLAIVGWALGHLSHDMAAAHRERLPAFLLGLALPAVALLAYPPFFRKAKSRVFGKIHDHRALRNYTINPMMRREQIAKDFLALRSGWGRKRYVRTLAKKCSSVTGQWPHGVMPYIDGDPGSKQLHLLDRSWEEQD